MKKVLFFSTFFLFIFSYVHSQNVYMCYKIEKGTYNLFDNKWNFTQYKDDINMPIFIYHSKIKIRNHIYYIMEKQIINNNEQNVICVNITTNKKAVIKINHYYNGNSLGLITLIVEEPTNKLKRYYLTTY